MERGGGEGEQRSAGGSPRDTDPLGGPYINYALQKREGEGEAINYGDL